MTASDSPDRIARTNLDHVEPAAHNAYDATARAFVEEVKAAVADGSIHRQLAMQTDLAWIIEEHAD
jgi:hypothetical protein